MSQSRKKLLVVSLGTASAALVIVASVAGWRISQVLSTARQEVRAEGTFGFVVRPYTAPSSSVFEVVSAPAVFRQAARFQDHMFIAGPAGLFEYDTNGTLLHTFSPGRELPSSSLVALAPTVLGDSREEELIVATEQEGLLAYNGRTWRQVLPREAEARTLTLLEQALVASHGRPLAATVMHQLQTCASQDVRELLPHLQARGAEYARDAVQRLTARGEAEARAMREILATQQRHIAATVAKHDTMDARQLSLTFGDNVDELRQLEANKRHWARRLAMLDEELQTEPDRIRAVYAVKATRVEPVGLIYLWPVTG